MTDQEDFFPTLVFGFILDGKGEQELSQMFVSNYGHTVWRPVPVIKEGMQSSRRAAVAGYVPEEDEDK